MNARDASQILFGIVAQRNDFIDGHALVDAFNRWSQDKSLTLAQVLVERGSIGADDCRLLEVLAARYMERFGGDAQRSLAALTSTSGVTVDLEPGEAEVHIRATVRTTDRTGVEMEALTAVVVAGLALHDMVKAVDPAAELDAVRVERKEGGRTGTWTRPEDRT